jgi:hypothetical protein
VDRQSDRAGQAGLKILRPEPTRDRRHRVHGGRGQRPRPYRGRGHRIRAARRVRGAAVDALSPHGRKRLRAVQPVGPRGAGGVGILARAGSVELDRAAIATRCGGALSVDLALCRVC